MTPVRIGQIAVFGLAGAILFLTLRPEHVNKTRSLIPLNHRQEMPDINLSDLYGRTWRLRDHTGQVVLVNFWATWCPPCREETPGLVHLEKYYRDKGVAVVGISMDEGGREAARKFAQDYRVGYPILLPDERFPFANSVDNLPTSVLIDQKGKVAKTYIGAVSETTFGSDIDKLLEASAKGAS